MGIRETAYPRQVILVSCRGEAKDKFSNKTDVKDKKRRMTVVDEPASSTLNRMSTIKRMESSTKVTC